MTLTNPDRFQTGKIKQSKYPNGESYLNEIYFDFETSSHLVYLHQYNILQFNDLN